MPWRQTHQAYAIWISEIMLQQTQVKTVIPYFLRWMERFPNVETLANANIDDILKCWEGLGYYTRARNIHKASKIIYGNFENEFPQTADALQKLPGIGHYTANAIASIAYQEIQPVVDGNVIRILSRFSADTESGNKAIVTKKYFDLLSKIIPHKTPGDFNQALMDFGRMVCKPQSPLCQECPIFNACRAFQQNNIDKFPVKVKKKSIPEIDIIVGIIHHKDKILLYQRPQERLLGGMWEFPGGQWNDGEDFDTSLKNSVLKKTGYSVHVGSPLTQLNHAYSHFKIKLVAYNCVLDADISESKVSSSKWCSINQLNDYAIHTSNKKIIPFIQKAE
jgi:A/G-specific adenine glycosylase